MIRNVWLLLGAFAITILCEGYLRETDVGRETEMRTNPIVSRQDMSTLQMDPNSELSTVLLWFGNNLVEWDVSSPDPALAPNLLAPFGYPETRSGIHIRDIAYDRQKQLLYSIEVPEDSTQNQQPVMFVVLTDLARQQQKTILQRTGIDRITLSPDRMKMTVTYFEGEYGASRSRLCVLDILTETCNEISLVIERTSGVWLDDARYLVIGGEGRMLHIVDVISGHIQELPIPNSWFIYSAAPIPGTSLLLLSARQKSDRTHNPSPILQFDMIGSVLTTYTSIPARASEFSIDKWLFSPDGTYLLYGSAYHMTLIEFGSGRTIAEFGNTVLIAQAGWLPHTNDIILSMISETESAVLIRVHADTSQVEPLLNGAQNIGKVIIPAS